MPAAADNVSVPLFLNKRREAGVRAAGPLLKTNEPVRRMLCFHLGSMTWHPMWSEAELGPAGQAHTECKKSIDSLLSSMGPTPRQKPSKDQWPDCQWLSLVALPQTVGLDCL